MMLWMALELDLQKSTMDALLLYQENWDRAKEENYLSKYAERQKEILTTFLKTVVYKEALRELSKY